MPDGSTTAVLIASLALLGCRSSASAVNEQTEPAKPESIQSEPTSKAEPTRSGPTTKAQPSADHAERVGDLEALCRALDHDYVDGTLSDYYAKVVPKTQWGRDRLREGEESITPGRLLQTAATSLAVDLESPELAGCRKLFDEIDDLE